RAARAPGRRTGPARRGQLPHPRAQVAPLPAAPAQSLARTAGAVAAPGAAARAAARGRQRRPARLPHARRGEQAAAGAGRARLPGPAAVYRRGGLVPQPPPPGAGGFLPGYALVELCERVLARRRPHLLRAQAPREAVRLPAGLDAGALP